MHVVHKINYLYKKVKEKIIRFLYPIVTMSNTSKINYKKNPSPIGQVLDHTGGSFSGGLGFWESIAARSEAAEEEGFVSISGRSLDSSPSTSSSSLSEVVRLMQEHRSREAKKAEETLAPTQLATKPSFSRSRNEEASMAIRGLGFRGARRKGSGTRVSRSGTKTTSGDRGRGQWTKRPI